MEQDGPLSPQGAAIPPLSVIIPLFNEERRLHQGLEGLSELRRLHGAPVEAILVDDGSQDGTPDLLRAVQDAEVRVLFAPHRGKGGAVRAGLAAATGERLLVTDVDWSVGPAQALRLLQAPADLVLAVREGPGALRIGEPALRHLLGRGFNRFVQVLLLAGHEDTQCGCKVLSRALVDDLLPRLHVDGWAWDVELLTVAHHRGFPVGEVPVCWHYEADSRVRPLRDALDMAREVLAARRRLGAGTYGPRR